MILSIAAAAHLKVFTLLLAYLLGGSLKIETKTFPTVEACVEAGQERANAISEDPRFGGGLFAGCVEEQGAKS